MNLSNLKNNVVWNNVEATEEQIKGYVNNYCNDFNVYYSNLIISNGNVSFTTYSKISYKKIVNKLIAEKYTIQDELAIQRKHQKGINIDEFNEYDAYVESCKTKAKAFIAERDEALNNG